VRFEILKAGDSRCPVRRFAKYMPFCYDDFFQELSYIGLWANLNCFGFVLFAANYHQRRSMHTSRHSCESRNPKETNTPSLLKNLDKNCGFLLSQE